MAATNPAAPLVGGLWRAVGCLLVSVVMHVSHAAPVTFEDTSLPGGMGGGTESWGAAAGDFNGDNWPDILMGGHRAMFVVIGFADPDIAGFKFKRNVVKPSLRMIAGRSL